MKEPWNWEYDDVQQLVADHVRESATLEYKSGVSRKIIIPKGQRFACDSGEFWDNLFSGTP